MRKNGWFDLGVFDFWTKGGSRMQDWQERVIAEKKELDEKLTKLWRFLSGEKVLELLSEDDLLAIQYGIMIRYSTVLQKRIARFKEGA